VTRLTGAQFAGTHKTSENRGLSAAPLCLSNSPPSAGWSRDSL